MNPYARAFEIVRYCYGSPDASSYFAYAVEDAIGPLPASVDLWGQEVELLRVFHAADSAEVRADIKRGDESRSAPLEEISAPGASGANEAINCAYSSGEVIFADEYGNWMLSVDTSEVHVAYLRTIPESADRSEFGSARCAAESGRSRTVGRRSDDSGG